MAPESLAPFDQVIAFVDSFVPPLPATLYETQQGVDGMVALRAFDPPSWRMRRV